MALWKAIEKATSKQEIRHIQDLYTEIEKALDAEKLQNALSRAKLIKK